MSKRRKARMIALEGLYQYETGSDPDIVLQLKWIKKLPEDIVNFALALLQGTIDNIQEIDNLIEKALNNEPRTRYISIVATSILRFSIYSMLKQNHIPFQVIVNEAIEITKIYGSEKSFAFINGILDFVNNELNSKQTSN